MHSRKVNPDIHSLVKGVMIESYIEEGNQKIGEGVYGKSITDPCLGWADSEKLLYELGIEAEYISARHIVLLPAPENDLTVIERLIERLPDLDEPFSLPEVTTPQHAVSIRVAALNPAERLPLKKAIGRICSNPAAPCPPGTASLH